jgi:hypothetical protein
MVLCGVCGEAGNHWSSSMTYPTAPSLKNAGDAVRLKAAARRKRALAPVVREDWGDPVGARFEVSEAAQMDARADAMLDPAAHALEEPRQGNGGELVVESLENRQREWAMDTLKASPDMLNADASVARLDLAAAAGSLTMAVDMAQSIQAEKSLERALAHQAATAHKIAMQLAAKASDFAGSISAYDPLARQQVLSIEAARMAGASARMMDVYQRALLTLERLRNGGKQTVVVQHVTVADGGQAMVAGAVTPGGQPK